MEKLEDCEALLLIFIATVCPNTSLGIHFTATSTSLSIVHLEFLHKKEKTI
jgi:hypothetical protein